MEQGIIRIIIPKMIKKQIKSLFKKKLRQT